MTLREYLTEIQSLASRALADLPPLPVEPTPILVLAGENVQAAIDAAPVGAVVELGPGTHTANVVLRQSVTLAGAREAVLQPADPFEPPLTVLGSDVVVRDFTIRNGRPDRDTVVVGDAYATTVEAQPHGVLLDSLMVQAGPEGGHRGIALHGVDLTVRECAVLGFVEQGRQSQGIWINNGPGPYTIIDSVIEGSGENILVGGSDPRIPNCIPSDILIARNEIRKPQAWRDKPGSVANLLELKLGQRVVIEDNVFDGNWPDIQAGHSIVFTVRNQDGTCPWALLDDVTFRRNVVKNTPDGFAVNILGSDNERPSQQTGRIVIDHNLFADAPMGFQVLNGVRDALVITNNTLPKIQQKFFSFYYTPEWVKVKTPLTFSANVLKAGEYGITGDGTVEGGPITFHADIVEWNGNVIEHHPDRALTYPAGTGNVLLPPGGLTPLLDPETFKLLIGAAAGY